MQTTLKKIRAYQPCKEGWEKLLKHLGKTKADDEQLSLLTVLDSNGLDDAIWCMRAIEGRDKEIRLYAVWCARQVQNLTKDPRSIAALDMAERFANGEATEKELAEVWAAAWAAANAASWAAACDAPWASAGATRRAAAWAAALAAASAASWAVDSAAVWAAVCDAAWAAANAAGRAAGRAAQAARLREVCNEVQGVKQ